MRLQRLGKGTGLPQQHPVALCIMNREVKLTLNPPQTPQDATTYETYSVSGKNFELWGNIIFGCLHRHPNSDIQWQETVCEPFDITWISA